MIWIGWIANLLLVYSWWRIGYKELHAILVGVVGSLLWAVKAWYFEMYDLLTIEIVLGLIQLGSWWRWKTKE